MFRIGHGFDTHRFVVGRPLILGGVIIPHDKGMEAHSDGDVVVHAICDAMLGALALGDIGQHFPDTAAEYKAINSLILLHHVNQLVRDNGYRINNMDTTILAETPKLALHIDKMREKLATELQLEKSQISIKATTNEKMGYIGRSEGIAVHAVVLLQKT